MAHLCQIAIEAVTTVLDKIAPEPSPLRNHHLFLHFGVSVLILHSVYHVLANTIFRGSDPKKLKQRCWVLTTFNGFVMTSASLPYLYDLMSSGFDLHAVKPRNQWLAEPLSCFFITYLLSDLGLGSIYYRHMINLSSGWVHHSVYTLLFLYWIHRGWAYIAVMACVFELPTFVMGIASLHPPWRSNNLFTSTFFLTRVFFHFGLLLATVTEHGRSTPAIGGSWGPAVSVICTYPMHLWWGYKCVKSIRRRMHKRKLEARKLQETTYFDSAGQIMTGLPDPSTSSAVNTPATTPGSSPVLSSADKKPSSAFQRAAAVAGSPISLMMGTKRRDSDINEKPLFLGESVMAPPNVSGSAPSFTRPVPPEGAHPEDRKPFLAIRSEAETRDRARRLIADAIRKAWQSAPDSWRQELETEMIALAENADCAGSAPMSRVPSDEANEELLSRTQRGKAAARRAVVRAIRRAINGKEGNVVVDHQSGDDEQERRQVAAAAVAAAVNAPNTTGQNGRDEGILSVPGAMPALDQVHNEKQAEEVILEARRQHRLLQMLLRLGGMTLPPDMLGQEYNVREFPVERNDQVGRHRRFVDQLRRRMEVANRDVVVFD